MDAGGEAAWNLVNSHLATHPWLGIFTLLSSFLVDPLSIESLSASTYLAQRQFRISSVTVSIRLAAKV